MIIDKLQYSHDKKCFYKAVTLYAFRQVQELAKILGLELGLGTSSPGKNYELGHAWASHTMRHGVQLNIMN